MSISIFMQCGILVSSRSSLRKRRRHQNSLHLSTFNDWSSTTMKSRRCLWSWGRENSGMLAWFFDAMLSGGVELVEWGGRLLSLPSFFPISFSSSKVYPKPIATSMFDNWICHCLFGFNAIEILNEVPLCDMTPECPCHCAYRIIYLLFVIRISSIPCGWVSITECPTDTVRVAIEQIQ